MSEVYDPGADDEFLDPAMLCVGFASHAQEIEPPHDRAVTFALFAQNSDDQFLEQSEYFVAAAKEALKEALATPDEPSAPSITPFKGHELLCYVAGLTLDQELIAQTDEDRRNFMLAQLAAKRRDATLVPQDPKSQESYKVLAAARNNDVDLARAIKDPRTRAVTLADIVCRLDRADTETFAQDPSYLLALEDEAWQELTTLVHEKVFYVSDLVNFAVNRGPRLILDITEKSGRLAAVSGYGFASRDRGDAEGVAWCKRQLTAELDDCQNDDERAVVVDVISRYAPQMGDVELVSLIPDTFEDVRTKALRSAAITRALKDEDAETLAALQPSRERDQALQKLALKPGFDYLVQKIEAFDLHNETLAKLAGMYAIQPLKESLMRQIMHNLTDAATSGDWLAEQAGWVVNMGDAKLARPLFERSMLPPDLLKKIAVELESIDLAVLIANKVTRETAVLNLATRLKQPAFIEISGASPYYKAEAYRELLFRA